MLFKQKNMNQEANFSALFDFILLSQKQAETVGNRDYYGGNNIETSLIPTY